MTENASVCGKLAADVIEACREAGLKLSTAESCTGGLIAAALTEISGSSDVFVGSVVSYWADVKVSVLGVDEDDIEKFGVVSEQVAAQMSRGACRVLDSELAVSTTGIAGPTGAEPGKPVGTVCIAVCRNGKVTSKTIHAAGNRRDVRNSAVAEALTMILDAIDQR